ncbi:MAG: hypothetical protein ACI88C_002954 [Acidimicrobiales bacterium]|jgi:hypothetical protein
MKVPKRHLVVVSLLAAVSLLAPTARAQEPTVEAVMNATVFDQSIFGGSYVTGGASAILNGNIMSGLYVTTGDSTTINGDVVAVTATTLGANAVHNGNIQSGTDTTLGASAWVSGNIQSGAGLTTGAGASYGTASTNTTPPDIADEQQQLNYAQTFLGGLEPNFVLSPGNIDTDIEFAPGVYEIAGLLSVTAAKTITLNANYDDGAVFIFNIRDYLTFGADANVVVINDDNDSSVVIWNAMSGYLSVGAGANIIGTVMAHGYVSTGAGSALSGVGTVCGGAVYSATSYVTVGAAGTIAASTPCEPPAGPPPTGPVSTFPVN